MKIIKRSGTEVTFDIDKIMAAVSKANNEVVHSERLSDEQIEMISKNVEDICQEMNRSLSVEEIQDLVENQIMNLRAFAVARKYITYRYKRALVRKSNSTDEQILSLLECNTIKSHLITSVSMDCYHDTRLDWSKLVKSICHWS